MINLFDNGYVGNTGIIESIQKSVECVWFRFVLYKDLDERLGESKYLAGNNYTIADIATWPWMARHEWHDIGMKNYKNLARWYLEIANREAVIKGYSFMDRDAKIPKL